MGWCRLRVCESDQSVSLADSSWSDVVVAYSDLQSWLPRRCLAFSSRTGGWVIRLVVHRSDQ